MNRQLSLFIFSLMSFATFAQSDSLVKPSYFLETPSDVPDYSAAYLVTDTDTLMTWNKTANRTILNYLNTKITHTVWADSAEVCFQEGYMLEDFQECCFRTNCNNKVISRTWKSVDEFRFSTQRKGVESFYVKSYSQGIKLKGTLKKNGEVVIELGEKDDVNGRNIDSLFQIVNTKEQEPKSRQSILVIFNGKELLSAVSNLSEQVSFKMIEEVHLLENSDAITYLYFENQENIVIKASELRVLKTTGILSLK